MNFIGSQDQFHRIESCMLGSSEWFGGLSDAHVSRDSPCSLGDQTCKDHFLSLTSEVCGLASTVSPVSADILQGSILLQLLHLNPCHFPNGYSYGRKSPCPPSAACRRHYCSSPLCPIIAPCLRTQIGMLVVGTE